MRTGLLPIASDNAATGAYDSYPASTWAQAGGRDTTGTESEQILSTLADILRKSGRNIVMALAIRGELSDGTPGTRPNTVSIYLREALLPTQLLALAIAVTIYSITSITTA